MKIDVGRQPINDALAQRLAAHAKHGANSIEGIDADSPDWLSILVEEVGEVAHALTYDAREQNLRAELVQVLAVAWAWIDALDGVVTSPSEGGGRVADESEPHRVSSAPSGEPESRERLDPLATTALRVAP